QATQASGAYAIPGSGSANYVSGIAFTQPAYEKEYQGMLNLDYQVNAKNTISSRYFRSFEPQNISFFGGNIPLPGDPGETDYGYQNGILKLTTIVSNSVVNELRGSVLRGTNFQTQNPGPGMFASNIYPA